MTGGMWGAWALIVPSDEAARAAAVARVGIAADDLSARHPNLVRLNDIVAPLSTATEEAVRSARALAEAKIVVADVTEMRPEIIFALGVRDLIADRLTIALHEGEPGADAQRIFGRRLTAAAPGAIAAKIAEAAAATTQHFQSDWRLRLGDYRISRNAKPLEKGKTPEARAREGGPTRWRIKNDGGYADTELGLWWGDVQQITEDDAIHALVNSENTYFEMGRIHDRGLSAVIRYKGAKWFDKERSDDHIYRELLAKAPFKLPARDGEVIITSSGSMARQGIRAIAHVASVRPAGGEGQAGKGYRVVEDIAGCVGGVLAELNTHFRRRPWLPKPTILLPLIGTGNAGADAGEISRKVIGAAVKHFRDHPSARIGMVLISAYSDIDLDHCDTVFQELEADGQLEPRSPARGRS